MVYFRILRLGGNYGSDTVLNDLTTWSVVTTSCNHHHHCQNHHHHHHSRPHDDDDDDQRWQVGRPCLLLLLPRTDWFVHLTSHTTSNPQSSSWWSQWWWSWWWWGGAGGGWLICPWKFNPVFSVHNTSIIKVFSDLCTVLKIVEWCKFSVRSKSVHHLRIRRLCPMCGQIYAKVGLACALKRVHLHSLGMPCINQIGIWWDREYTVSTQTRH